MGTKSRLNFKIDGCLKPSVQKCMKCIYNKECKDAVQPVYPSRDMLVPVIEPPRGV